MGKHASPAHAPALLSLLLLMCFAIHAHCRIIDDKSGEKNGLCAYKNHAPDCKSLSLCYCCSGTNDCYKTMYLCGLECNKSSSSSSELSTPSHPPLPSRQL
uniref:Uncharacterized protein n=1 Tax=Avena sativa TaxID=4498 RepID=A0ACD5TBJ8_AVESA